MIRVYTLLADKKNIKEFEELGFEQIEKESFSIFKDAPELSEIDKKCSLKGGAYFIRGGYDDFLNALNKKYNAKDVEYEFKLNPHFKNEEKYLHFMCMLYGLNYPVVFSPFARRAVNIHILSDVSDNEINNLNFDNGNLISNSTLMWNLKISNIQSYSDNAVDNGMWNYKYNAKENEYIIPLLDYEDYREAQTQQEENTINIILPKRIDLNIKEVKKITINDIDESKLKGEYFYNAFNADMLNKKTRIRTAGDLNYVLNALSFKDYSAKYIKENAWKKVVAYNEKHDYYFTNYEEILRNEKSNIIAIGFSGNDEFLTDYANYVLAYLNEYYSEYKWEGVYI